MIKDHHKIKIHASPDVIFSHIETYPFPTFKFFETRPFLFFRATLVAGLKSGIRSVLSGNLFEYMNEPLEPGATVGPFIVTEVEKGKKLYFSLNSFFSNCITGFTITEIENGSLLSFDLFSHNLKLREKVWWLIFKPVHGILARRVLRVHKRASESVEGM